jgi:SAM-dependent methyltransferase
MTATQLPDVTREVPDAFVARFHQSTGGFLDILGIYLGERLGWYRALADYGPMPTWQLAAMTGTNERYAREWLEEQTTAGILVLEDVDAIPADRRYCLPEIHRDALVNPDSHDYLPARARVLVGLTRPLDALLDAMRNGAGLPESAYGADVREGQAAVTRPWYQDRFATSVLPLLPDVAARLTRTPAARVADVGCGPGWAGIAIAQAYPLARIDRFDVDHCAVSAAGANAVAADLSVRARYHLEDLVARPPDEPYDLAICCHYLHLLPRPVELLRALRKATRPDGAVLIGEPPVDEFFSGQANLDERIAYGMSLFFDLPVGMSDRHSAGTGGLLRPALLREYALAAGFADVIALPVPEGGRFYRLAPPGMTTTETEASQRPVVNLEWLEMP